MFSSTKLAKYFLKVVSIFFKSGEHFFRMEELGSESGIQSHPFLIRRLSFFGEFLILVNRFKSDRLSTLVSYF